MSTVLVTGARGFVGARLGQRLERDGHAVTPLTRAEQPRVMPQCIEVDLARAEHVRTIETAGFHFDVVVHLAGRVEIALVPASQASERPIPGVVTELGRLYADNVLATAHIVQLCERMGTRHLVFASSQTVYGMPEGDGAFFETSPCRPLEHYAASKLACEVLLEVASRRGLAVTVLRFPGLFSEDREAGVVRRFCESAVRCGVVNVSSPLPLPFDVLHVDDLVDAMARCIADSVGAVGFRRFNIASGEPCSLDLLAADVAGLVPGCRVQRDGAAQPVIRMDSTGARRALGWEPAPRRERLAAVVAAVRP